MKKIDLSVLRGSAGVENSACGVGFLTSCYLMLLDSRVSEMRGNRTFGTNDATFLGFGLKLGVH